MTDLENAKDHAAISRVHVVFWTAEVQRLATGARDSIGWANDLKLSDLRVVLARLENWPRTNPEGTP